jgi:alpha-tubulin suppressor-like RCC1 family protein
MSGIINKFDCLRNLNEKFKRNIKLLYVCHRYFSQETEVLIITNECVCAFEKDYDYWSVREFEMSDMLIINELCNKRVIDFKNSEDFLFARTFDGNVYYWGLDTKRKWKELANPKLIKSLINRNIIDICCGNKYVIALTDKGIVFSSDSQIYCNLKEFKHLKDFNKIKKVEFNGEKVKAISCGSEHSMALTENGAVFSWGNNCFGQLGVGDYEKKEKPKLVLLNDIIIEKISCGKNHSLLLSRDGDIYGFGDNSCGQLGMKDRQNAEIPIKINNFSEIETEISEMGSKETKSFRENKFIDIATHSLHNISIALSVNGTYYYWGNGVREPKESDIKSFDEIFAVNLKITAKTIRIQSDNNFVPNDKYKNEFEEISQIGSGSYGKVFKVKLKSSAEFFAIKKIAITDENESLKELCTSLLISELNNDLIIRYHDVWYENDLVEEKGFRKFTENSTLYIQMDLCEKTLEEIREEIANDSILKLKKLLTPLGFYITTKILIEILKAVEYFHKLNIIHRDLKPENILFSNGFNNRFVKIADFGLAKVHDKSKLNTEDKGDVRYMAPEVAFSKKYDTKADIYSLGVITQELFHIDFYE